MDNELTQPLGELSPLYSLGTEFIKQRGSTGHSVTDDETNALRLATQTLQQPTPEITPSINKESNYATSQNGPFYRVSPKSSGGNRQFSSTNEEQIWPASPADANGSGPIRYGDTQYDKTTYKPYKVMPSEEQNIPLQSAQTYVSSRGLPQISQPNMPSSSLSKQSAIGRTYALAAEDNPEYKNIIFNAYARSMPEVIKQSGASNYDELLQSAYQQMAKETSDQFQALPLRYSYHQNGEGNYVDSPNMLHDLHDNGHLFVFQGGDKHDFLHNIDPETGLNENEKFRAVHDAFGHGIFGNTFGPEGEERAWSVHSQMYSPLAQLAMTAETRGQNSFVNYTPANVDIKERIYEIEKQMADVKRFGTPSEMEKLKDLKKDAYNQFNFAPNKAVLLPPEYLSTSYNGGIPEYLQPLITPEQGTTLSSSLTHYSSNPSLTMTDPSKYGTGLRGDERNRVLAGGIKDRTYFYLGEPNSITPEPGLGASRYGAQGENLYDASSDPAKLYRLAKMSNVSSPLSNFNPNSVPHEQIMNDVERLAKEYGYSGVAHPDHANPMAIMFNPTPVQRQNTGGAIEDHAMDLIRKHLDHEDHHAA